MKTLVWIIVVLGGCGGTTNDTNTEPEHAPVAGQISESEEDEAAAAASSFVPMLDAAVADVVMALPIFEGWTVVPFAQVERGDRIAVALWPAIDPEGRVVDDDIIGVTLSRGDDGALAVVAENWSTRQSGALDEQLGGEPTEIKRNAGVPADQLGERLQSLPARFAEHVRVGDRDAATEAAIAFSRLFAFETAVLDDTVSELLGHHVNDGARLETAAPVTQGERTRVRTQFFEGDTLAEAEDLIATPLEGDTARWVFTEHERVDAGDI